MLSQEAIDELKAIHKEEFGEDLTDDEAREMGNRLLRVFSLLASTPKPTDPNQKE